MSKIIYFATPYSHSDKSVIEDRYLKTASKVAELTSQGLVVMSPIFYGHNLLNYLFSNDFIILFYFLNT